MQVRPPPGHHQTPAMLYQPPIAPAIPSHIGQLIPRIRIAIQDIDVFQNMVAQGVIDSSMPSWDALIRQYTILMGRLSAISQSLTSMSSPPPSNPDDSDPSSTSRSTPTSLRQYLLTPLNPLPADAEPMVQAAFMESLNTMPLQDLQLAMDELLDSQAGWKPMTELRGMDEGALLRYRGELQKRLERESVQAARLGGLARAGELKDTWKSRIGEGEDAEDEEDDLFDEPMEEKAGTSGTGERETAKLPNPREGWDLADYVRYIDSGVLKA